MLGGAVGLTVGATVAVGSTVGDPGRTVGWTEGLLVVGLGVGAAGVGAEEGLAVGD